MTHEPSMMPIFCLASVPVPVVADAFAAKSALRVLAFGGAVAEVQEHRARSA